MSDTDQIALIGVCQEIVKDGVLTKAEIVELAKWINAHPNVKNGWPGKPLVKLLRSVVADKVISKSESRQVGAALQSILRFGVELVDQFDRWEKLADDIGPYIVLFRSGKSLKAEVVEMEMAEIEEKSRGKSRVVVDCLFPKRIREDGETWLEWEKEKRLVVNKIEYVKLLITSTVCGLARQLDSLQSRPRQKF